MKVNTSGLAKAVDGACAEMDRLRAINAQLLEALEAILPILKIERVTTRPLSKQLAWDEPIATIEEAIRKAKGTVPRSEEEKSI